MKTRIDLQIMEKVRKRRMEQNVSQAELAEEIGITPGFIGQIESPSSRIRYSAKQLYDIARYLGCTPGDFFPPIEPDDKV